MRTTARIVGIGMLTLITACPVHAQGEGTKTPVAHKQVISASPLLMMFKWFNVDYERKISSAVTLGASGSYLPLRDASYQRATVHARYYPQGAALTGFFFGGQTGVHEVPVYRSRFKHERVAALGTGADVGYSWLFGERRDVGLSISYGATRLFGRGIDGSTFGPGESIVIPNVRLFNIGIAF